MRIFARIVLILLLLIVLAAGAAVFQASRMLDAAAVAARIEQYLTALTGTECRLEGGVEISFFPRLAVTLNNLVILEPRSGESSVQAPEGVLARVGRLHAAVALKPLLDRTLDFERIILESPSVTLRTLPDGDMPWRRVLDRAVSAGEVVISAAEESTTEAERHALAGGLAIRGIHLVGVDVENGLFEWRDESVAGTMPAAALGAEGVHNGTSESGVHLFGNATARTTDGGTHLGNETGMQERFTVAPVLREAPAMEQDTIPFVRVSRLNMEVDTNGRLTYESSFVLESSVVPAHVAVTAGGEVVQEEHFSGVRSATSTVALKGNLYVGERAVPLSVRTALRFDHAADTLIVDGLSADIDGAGIAGALQVNQCSAAERNLAGVVEVRKLSLPYWFGFGEFLPTSLQHALDSLDGTLALRMDSKGLVVDSLDVSLLGMQLSGKGAVEDFSRPVIYIDVEGTFVDVNRIFPEIMENPPSRLPQPARPGKAVFEADIEEDDNPDDDIGYDIRVRAAKGTARSFQFGDLAFRCWPMQGGGTNTSYSIGSFYGGKVEALLGIHDVLTLDLNVANVQTAEVSRLVTGEPVLGGTLSGKARVQSGADTIWGMVAGLEGTLEATLQKGSIQTMALRDGTKPRHNLDSFSVTLKGKTQHPDPDKATRYLPYHWDMKMDFVPAGTQERYDVQLVGPVVIDSRRALPVQVKDARTTFRWQGTDAPFGKTVPIDFSLTGRMDLDLEKETVRFSQATASAQHVSAVCSVEGSQLLGSVPVWEGSLVTDEVSLREFLPRYGKDVWDTADPRALNAATLRTRFRSEGRSLVLRDMDMLLDRTKVTGFLSLLRGETPTVRFTLRGDFLDADRYMPPADESATRPAASPPWKLDWMHRNDVAGEIAVDHIIYRNLEFSALNATVAVAGGRMRVSPLRAGMYKGTATGELDAVARDGLDTRVAVRLRKIDLEPAALRFAGNEYVGGTLSASVDMQGLLRNGDDIPGAFSGTWGFDITKGHYSFGTRADGERSRTPFDKASASGVMERGVLKNDDLSMSSLLMSMSGKGVVDLARKNLDYQINVTYAEVPTFPVRIYGSFSDPKTSIRGAEIIPRTIGKLGGGIFNIFRRVITTPFSVLETLGNLGSTNSTRPRR